MDSATIKKPGIDSALKKFDVTVESVEPGTEDPESVVVKLCGPNRIAVTSGPVIIAAGNMTKLTNPATKYDGQEVWAEDRAGKRVWYANYTFYGT